MTEHHQLLIGLNIALTRPADHRGRLGGWWKFRPVVDQTMLLYDCDSLNPARQRAVATFPKNYFIKWAIF